MRIEGADLRALDALAREKGVPSSTMARMILREALRRPMRQKPAAGAKPESLVIPRERLEALPTVVARAVEALLQDAQPAPTSVSEKRARYRAPAKKASAPTARTRRPKASG